MVLMEPLNLLIFGSLQKGLSLEFFQPTLCRFPANQEDKYRDEININKWRMNNLIVKVTLFA